MPMRQLFSCTVNFTDDHVTAYVKGRFDTDTAQCLFAQLVPYVAAGSGSRRSGRSGRAHLHGAAGIIVLARPEAVRCEERWLHPFGRTRAPRPRG
jgi:hypothetical protein